MAPRGKQKEQANFIAEKLNYLFENVMSPLGRPYTLEAVQAATGIHASYIGKMRSAKIANPGHDVLAALSNFFGVNPDYWFQTENRLTQRDPRAQQLSILHRQLEQAEFSVEQIRFIQQLVETMRQVGQAGVQSTQNAEAGGNQTESAPSEGEENTTDPR